MRKYYGYVRDVWSKDFGAAISDLSRISGVIFLVKQNDRVLFEVPEERLNDALEVLSRSVRSGAWHDLVSGSEVIVIFASDDVRKISIDASTDDETWWKMKELEPSIRKYATLKAMIRDSQYAPYL